MRNSPKLIALYLETISDESVYWRERSPKIFTTDYYYYMPKAINKIQGSLTGQCKTLEEKVSSFTVDNASMDASSSTGTGECIISSVVNPQAAKHGTSDVFGVLKELEDCNRRKTIL